MAVVWRSFGGHLVAIVCRQKGVATHRVQGSFLWQTKPKEYSLGAQALHSCFRGSTELCESPRNTYLELK